MVTLIRAPRVRAWIAGSLLLHLIAACAAPPPEASVKPGINEDFLAADVDPGQFVERFEREGREVYDRRHELVAALDLEPGTRVADVGAGTGLFTPLLAGAVGHEGKVYAVDIVPRFLELVEERCAGMDQVETVLGSERSCGLPRGSVDLAFVCDTYHHFEYPRTYLASLHRAIRPGGTLAIVDFERIPGVSSAWIMGHVRAGKKVVEREITNAGFDLVSRPDLLEQNYLLLFERR